MNICTKKLCVFFLSSQNPRSNKSHTNKSHLISNFKKNITTIRSSERIFISALSRLNSDWRLIRLIAIYTTKIGPLRDQTSKSFKLIHLRCVALLRLIRFRAFQLLVSLPYDDYTVCFFYIRLKMFCAKNDFVNCQYLSNETRSNFNLPPNQDSIDNH